MFQIGSNLVSLEVIEKKFRCDLGKCKGACCIHGDAGAPLEEDELAPLEESFPEVKAYLKKENIEALEKQGLYTIDADGDKVTSLLNGKECAFVVFENGIAKCAIEKAFFDGKIKFRKPVSCHLYPIRISKYSTYDAVNFHEWDICKSAIKAGERENLPVFSFLKEPLTRKYGEQWYTELSQAAREYLKFKENQQGKIEY